MALATVKSLHRYPVKSMGGELLQQTSFETLGIPGDRGWALRDETRGGIRGGKRFPELMGLQATCLEEPSAHARSPLARIEFPDGTSARTDDADINERLSEHLHNPVTLWPLLPADALDHYRRGAPESSDMEAELRRAFGRTADEPLPDLSQFPAELFEYESPPGTYFDAFPVLLLSQASLDSMTAAAPEQRFDVRRFRPNLLLETPPGETGFPEDAWAGKRLQIGDAIFELQMRCPRCVMTTHGFGDLPKDPGIMRALVRAHGGDLGVYAQVVQPGIVRAGDTAVLL